MNLGGFLFIHNSFHIIFILFWSKKQKKSRIYFLDVKKKKNKDVDRKKKNFCKLQKNDIFFELKITEFGTKKRMRSS